MRLSGFGSFDFEFGAEDPVPEAAGYAEAVGVVGVVVLEVVVFELAVVGWESVAVVRLMFVGGVMLCSRLTACDVGSSGSSRSRCIRRFLRRRRR